MKKMYRQGDVLLVEHTDSLRSPVALPRENGRIVLAHGEFTGHAHAISDMSAGIVRDRRSGSRILQVVADSVNLRHEEHAPIKIPQGTYRIVRQREFVPEAPQKVRQVYD